jgi:hypothetical protein
MGKGVIPIIQQKTKREENMNMKISGLMFLMISAAVFGLEQGPIASLLGAVPAEKPVTELRVLQDLKGGAYVLAIADGAFTVIRGKPEGTFEPYEIRGFPAAAVRARDLQISASGPVQYAAFIGGEGPLESICVFGLDPQGELAYYPVPETKMPGPISEFNITGLYNGSADLYLLRNGRLSCVTGIGARGALGVYQNISLSGEHTGAFGLIGDLRQGPRYGWYGASSGEDTEIILFSISENGVLKREQLGVYPGDVRVSHSAAFDRTVVLTLIHESQVEVFHETGSGFLRNFSFTAPVPVTRYYSAKQIGGDVGILTGGSGGEERLYGVWYENTGAPVLREWLSVRDGSVEDMIYAGANQAAVLYQDPSGWHSALIDFAGNFLGEKPIRGPESGAKLLYSGGVGDVSLCMADKKDGGRLLFYGLTGGDWKLLRQLPIPETIWEPGIQGEDIFALNPFYADWAAVPLVLPAALVLYETESGIWQSIGGMQRSWSRVINDRIFLAVYTGRELALYRMEG